MALHYKEGARSSLHLSKVEEALYSGLTTMLGGGTGPAAEGNPYRTDEANWILDTEFGAMRDPEKLASELDALIGVVEHGLFLGMANVVIVADWGQVKTLRAPVEDGRRLKVRSKGRGPKGIRPSLIDLRPINHRLFDAS